MRVSRGAVGELISKCCFFLVGGDKGVINQMHFANGSITTLSI
jgi:hypothetical protein